MTKEKYSTSIKSTGEQIACVDYGVLNLNELEDKILNPKNTPILQICTPEQISCYGYAWINIRTIGCKYNGNQIIEKWRSLSKDGWLLDNIAEELIISDYKDSLKTSEYQTGIPENYKERRFLPSWHYLTKLTDLYLQIENSEAYNKIEGFKRRMNEAKKELNRKLNGDIGKLFEKIISIVSELTFISNLCSTSKINWNKLNVPKKRSDFQMDIPFFNKPNIHIEMKTRTKDFVPLNEPYEILELSIPASLVYFANLSSLEEKAFNSKKQNADIVFVDIAHCYGGHLFRHADPTTKKGNLSFEYALNESVELVKNNKKSVILFMELYTPFQVIVQPIEKGMFDIALKFVKETEKDLMKKKCGAKPTPDEIVKEIDRITKNLPEN